MIKSMTGYGRGEAELHNRSIVIELKSVNNRYLDCSVRLPRSCSFGEEGIKKPDQSRHLPGQKWMSLSPWTAPRPMPWRSRSTALWQRSYMQAFGEMSEAFGIQNDVTVSALARFPDVLTVEKLPQDQDALAADLYAALDLAPGGLRWYAQRRG